MKKEKHTQNATQKILQSKAWYFFSRDVALKYCRLAGRHFASREDMLKAPDVFEVMGLDLSALSQIFVTNPDEFYSTPKEKRPVQPKAVNYQELGLCRTQDDEGWVALAKLAGREIRLILGESDGELMRIYYPNGEMKRIDWYHRFFNLVPAEDIRTVRWYHRWLHKVLSLFTANNFSLSLKKGKRAKLRS